MRVVLAAAVALVAAVGVTAFAVFAGWPGHTGSESGTFGAVLKIPKYSPGSLAFSQDGKILAVGASSSDGNHGSTYLVSLVTHRVTATLTDKAADQVDSVAFNPNGKTLAVANSSGGINVWSLADNKIVTNLSGASFLGATFSFAFSSDGKSLAEGDVSLFGGGSNNLSPLTTAIRLWNLSTGKVAASRTFPTDANTTILLVAFNPDGKTVAANIDGGNIYLWNLADQRMVKLFTIPGSQEVSSLKFSPDGTTLAVGDMNGNVYLWSLAGHRIAATLTGPRKSAVEAVAFSPDGTTLAAGNSNGRTYLWAVASHHVTATLTDPRGNGVNSVAYSPKGTTLAVGDDNGSIYIWNIRKGTS